LFYSSKNVEFNYRQNNLRIYFVSPKKILYAFVTIKLKNTVHINFGNIQVISELAFEIILVCRLNNTQPAQTNIKGEIIFLHFQPSILKWSLSRFVLGLSLVRFAYFIYLSSNNPL